MIFFEGYEFNQYLGNIYLIINCENEILTEIIWVLINNNLNIKVMDFIGVIIFAAIAQFLLMTAWRPDIDDLTNSEYFRWPGSKFFSSKIFNKGNNIVILVGKIAQRI